MHCISLSWPFYLTVVFECDIEKNKMLTPWLDYFKAHNISHYIPIIQHSFVGGKLVKDVSISMRLTLICDTSCFLVTLCVYKNTEFLSFTEAFFMQRWWY